MRHLAFEYFVLDPHGEGIRAKASQAAIREYARIIESEDSTFAKDLKDWANGQLKNVPVLTFKSID